MNPLAILNLLWEYKALIVLGLLVSALGVQTYRLRGAELDLVAMTGKRDLLALEKTERARRDGMRDMQNLKNRERTNEEYAAALRRAAAVVVRGEPAGGVVPGAGIKLAAGGDPATGCIDRGRLDAELAGWVEWHAAGLNNLLARISRRGDEAFTRTAREGEGLAASYRGCRVYTLNLAR